MPHPLPGPNSPSTTSLAEERIESLKAGGIGAIALGFSMLLVSAVPAWPAGISLALVGHSAIALITGGLFGVTYRYIVRQEANPQLQAGAVMAFGLMRGLAQIEPLMNAPSPTSLAAIAPDQWLVWGLILVQNIGPFAIAQVLLQQCFNRGWVKPFGDN